MPNLITYADFKLSFQIAQLNSAAVQADVTSYITSFESKFLKLALGYDLSKRFAAGLLVDPIAAIWTDLRDGKEFTDGEGNLQKWEGIKPLITAYVYFMYRTDRATDTSGTGEVIPMSERSYRTSAAVKMIAAWRFLTSELLVMWNYLYSRKADYALTDEDFSTRLGETIYQYYLTQADLNTLTSSINEFDI